MTMELLVLAVVLALVGIFVALVWLSLIAKSLLELVALKAGVPSTQPKPMLKAGKLQFTEENREHYIEDRQRRERYSHISPYEGSDILNG